jgi:hypothetical protein
MGGRTHLGVLPSVLILELEQALLRWTARESVGSAAGRSTVVVAILLLLRLFEVFFYL